MIEATKKTDRSFISLKLFKEIISPLEHSGVNVTNRHSVEHLGHVGSNKLLLLDETIRKYIQS